MNTKHILLFGAAFLNGTLVDNYDGEVTDQQIRDIVNSESFTWLSEDQFLTTAAADEEALESGDADFYLEIEDEVHEGLTPSQVKEKLSKINI